MLIKLKQIDPDDDEAADDIDELHEITFGDAAPMLRPLYGHWWIGYQVNPLGPPDFPAAFAGYVVDLEAEPGAGYMKRCGVTRPFRGQGLQRRFIRAREAHAKKNGIKRMVTDTTDNVQSSNSLIRAGYRLYEPQKPWAFSNSLYWYKDLT